jgi:hypothetical protein
VSQSAHKGVWCVKAYVHATEVEAQDVAERLGTAMCPDLLRRGYCPIPWTIETSRPTGKAAEHLKEHFADERAAAEATAKKSAPADGD